MMRSRLQASQPAHCPATMVLGLQADTPWRLLRERPGERARQRLGVAPTLRLEPWERLSDLPIISRLRQRAVCGWPKTLRPVTQQTDLFQRQPSLLANLPLGQDT